MSLTYQELIDTIESNPSGVREALELVKRQLGAYPDATEAELADALALFKADGSGATERVDVETLLSRLSVENFTELQSFNPNVAGNVYVLGRTTKGDGGEGHFRWDSSDLSTEVGNDEVTAEEGDGGIYVAPTSDKTGASGAWVRQFSGTPNAFWYGVEADGTTDDSTALAAADNAGAFLIPDGTVLIGSNTTLSSSVFMGDSATLKPDSGITLNINGLYHPPRVGHGFDQTLGTVQIGTVTKSVPTDFPTVQEAIDACPLKLFQEYSISLADGTYNEHVRIPSIVAGAIQPDPSQGREISRLSISGANGVNQDPNVVVNSFTVHGCLGGTGHPTIQDLTTNNASPYTDEGEAIGFYGCVGPIAQGISFDGVGVTRCIQSYNSIIEARGNDFGSSVNDFAYSVKHGGQIHNRQDGGREDSGTVLRSFIRTQNGSVYSTNIGNVRSIERQINFLSDQGIVVDGKSGEIYTKGSDAHFTGRNVFETYFESIDGWANNGTVGSGGLTLDAQNGYAQITTTNSSGDTTDRQFRGKFSSDTFENVVFRARLDDLNTDLGDANGIFYIIAGDRNSSYLGFKVENDGGGVPTLWGVSNNGSDGEDSVPLTTTLSQGAVLTAIQFDWGCQFYLNEGNLQSTTTTGFASFGTAMASLYIETTQASALEARIYSVYINKP